MAHLSLTSGRTLSLTEELEKLEQSVTLTLQEIDHNFSRAHRIVTTRIIPIIEQYAEQSTAVWEGSKFWKQFFEASANVSLSGYEELAADGELDDTTLSQSQGNMSAADISTPQPSDNTKHEEIDMYEQANDSLLDNGDVSGSTPRPLRGNLSVNGKPKLAKYSSPHKALKRELKSGHDSIEIDSDGQRLPLNIPGVGQRLPDMSMTPTSSPFAPRSQLPPPSQIKGPDLLLHRVLDKNYRLTWKETASEMSSPLAAAPQLRSESLSSPITEQPSRLNALRTPGVSIQTPLKRIGGDTRSRYTLKDEIGWESDSDENADDIYQELGISPPKTIQFAIAPSRLLQTPAREASKRIVADLLLTAGIGRENNDMEDSPTMIKMNDDILDDSF